MSSECFISSLYAGLCSFFHNTPCIMWILLIKYISKHIDNHFSFDMLCKEEMISLRVVCTIYSYESNTTIFQYVAQQLPIMTDTLWSLFIDFSMLALLISIFICDHLDLSFYFLYFLKIWLGQIFHFIMFWSPFFIIFQMIHCCIIYMCHGECPMLR